MNKSNFREMYWKMTSSEPNYIHLEKAILNNDIETFNLLFNLGLDPNGFNDSGYSPLIIILLISRNIEFLELILYYGADPNLTDRRGNIPLLTAVSRSPINYVELLLNNDKLIKNKELLDELRNPDWRAFIDTRKNKKKISLIQDYIDLDMSQKRLNISKKSTIQDTNISDLPTDLLESISKHLDTLSKTKKGGQRSKKKKSKKKKSKRKKSKNKSKKRNK